MVIKCAVCGKILDQSDWHIHIDDLGTFGEVVDFVHETDVCSWECLIKFIKSKNEVSLTETIEVNKRIVSKITEIGGVYDG